MSLPSPACVGRGQGLRGNATAGTYNYCFQPEPDEGESTEAGALRCRLPSPWKILQLFPPLARSEQPALSRVAHPTLGLARAKQVSEKGCSPPRALPQPTLGHDLRTPCQAAFEQCEVRPLDHRKPVLCSPPSLTSGPGWSPPLSLGPTQKVCFNGSPLGLSPGRPDMPPVYPFGFG